MKWHAAPHKAKTLTTYSVVQLVLAVQWLQIGKILPEDVDVRLQKRLPESLGKLFQHSQEKKWGQLKHDSIQKGYGGNFNDICKRTCMAAVNWAAFSMVSSEAPLWTVVKIEVLKKYLQFWWSIWYNNSNISALTSGEDCFKKNETCTEHLLCNKSDECQSISNYITTKRLMILIISSDQVWIV